MPQASKPSDPVAQERTPAKQSRQRTIFHLVLTLAPGPDIRVRSKVMLFLFFALQLPQVRCFVFQMQDQNLPSENFRRSIAVTRWNVPFSAAKQGLKQMREDGVQWSTAVERTALRFLYVKNVFQYSLYIPDDEARKTAISELLRPRVSSKVDFRDARARLFRLFDDESCFASNILPTNVMSYSFFLRCTPAWQQQQNTYVFFDDDSWKWQMQIRQRVQESCLCYMHAPMVLQSYLVSFYHRNSEQPPPCEMLEMRRFIVENFSGTDLHKHIVDKEGGMSVDYLESILEPGSKVVRTWPEAIDASLIKRVGPILVYQFQVYDDFLLAGRLSYLEEPSGKKIGRHAMLIVGVREEDGQKVFLLQNWGRRKQFVEVGDRYLTACSANFCFVQTPQKGVPTFFKGVYTTYAETTNLDKMEGYWTAMASIRLLLTGR